MVTKSNDPLTEAELAKYNAAITDFVKKNSDFVDYAELDDGNTYITLRYGSIRSSVASALREIANRCRTSLIDDQFKIGDLSCTIVFANTSILRFSGKTNVIHSELKELESNGTSPLNTLIVASKVNVEMLPDEDIASFAADLKTLSSAGQGRSYDPTLTESTKKDVGVTFSNYGGKEHVSLALKKVMSSELATTDFGKTLGWITKTYSEDPKMITVTLSEKLAALHVYLERVNDNTIMLAYDYIGETKNQGGQGSQDEFTYTPTPGSITKLIVHYTPLSEMTTSGTGANGPRHVLPTNNNITIDDFDFVPFVRRRNTGSGDEYTGCVAVKTKDGVTIGYQDIRNVESADAQFTITDEEKQNIYSQFFGYANYEAFAKFTAQKKVILTLPVKGWYPSTILEINNSLRETLNYALSTCENEEIQEILWAYCYYDASSIGSAPFDIDQWKQDIGPYINADEHTTSTDVLGTAVLTTESGLFVKYDDVNHDSIRDFDAYTAGEYNDGNGDSIKGYLGLPSIDELKNNQYFDYNNLRGDYSTMNSVDFDYSSSSHFRKIYDNIIQTALKTGKALNLYLSASYADYDD
jgi:hypothetical protein